MNSIHPLDLIPSIQVCISFHPLTCHFNVQYFSYYFRLYKFIPGKSCSNIHPFIQPILTTQMHPQCILFVLCIVCLFAHPSTSLQYSLLITCIVRSFIYSSIPSIHPLASILSAIHSFILFHFPSTGGQNQHAPRLQMPRSLRLLLSTNLLENPPAFPYCWRIPKTQVPNRTARDCRSKRRGTN